MLYIELQKNIRITLSDADSGSEVVITHQRRPNGNGRLCVEAPQSININFKEKSYEKRNETKD